MSLSSIGTFHNNEYVEVAVCEELPVQGPDV
jgi:hypothetical protein